MEAVLVIGINNLTFKKFTIEYRLDGYINFVNCPKNATPQSLAWFAYLSFELLNSHLGASRRLFTG